MGDGSKMILKDFYKILGRSGPETEVNPAGMTIEKYRFSLELNPEHPVYEGHFPGNPVVPGVCQVQMICDQHQITRLKTRVYRAGGIGDN